MEMLPRNNIQESYYPWITMEIRNNLNIFIRNILCSLWYKKQKLPCVVSVSYLMAG